MRAFFFFRESLGGRGRGMREEEGERGGEGGGRMFFLVLLGFAMKKF